MNQVLTFYLREKLIAINIEVVKEVIQIDQFIEIPLSNEAIIGLTTKNDKIITLLDTKIALNFTSNKRYIAKNKLFIITEYKQELYGLCIDILGTVEQVKIIRSKTLDDNYLANFKLNKKNGSIIDFDNIISKQYKTYK